jgi:hypothetical protein
VDQPLPRWLELWPWFTWPALAVGLFGLHRLLVQRRGGCKATCQVGRPGGARAGGAASPPSTTPSTF